MDKDSGAVDKFGRVESEGSDGGDEEEEGIG